MIRLNGSFRRACIAAVALLALAGPAPSQQVRVNVLAQLERGLWQLRDQETNAVRHPSICLGSAKLLLQVQHRGRPCSQLLVSQDERSATVHYTCPSSGYGQTLLKLETPRLAQIDTQGIADGSPFSYRLEARRVGACGSGRTASR
jgi:hypothetical protein